MNSKLFVGNLSFETTENDIQDLFGAVAPVSNTNLIVDRATGRSRGFAFVTMTTNEGAEAAVQKLDGKSLNGRDIKVSEAREREERRPAAGSKGPRQGGNGRREFSNKKW